MLRTCLLISQNELRGLLSADHKRKNFEHGTCFEYFILLKEPKWKQQESKRLHSNIILLYLHSTKRKIAQNAIWWTGP